jgi:hypothetical protein
MFELIQHAGLSEFTASDLQHSYESLIDCGESQRVNLRVYVYEQIRRMKAAGVIIQDEHAAIYRVSEVPIFANVTLLEVDFHKLKGSLHQAGASIEMISAQLSKEIINALECLIKEVRVDYISSVGEVERYKKIIKQIPQLEPVMAKAYSDARYRSSHLTGSLRALEETITALELLSN